MAQEDDTALRTTSQATGGPERDAPGAGAQGDAAIAAGSGQARTTSAPASQEAPSAEAPKPPESDGPSGAGRGKAHRGTKKKNRKPRPHPYADEVSPPRETALHASRVTFFWAGLATALAAGGLYLGDRFSPYMNGRMGLDQWEGLTEIPLFLGLLLLGFGFVGKNWARRLVLAGWLIFGFYWALVAWDLLISESMDYVNFLFALVGTYFFTYLAYHQWLNEVRGVENHTVRFLNISTFIAATSFFAIDKIQTVSTWLILKVSDHTYTMLGWFGQAQAKGLAYVYDPHPTQIDSPTSFFYPQYYCDPNRVYEGTINVFDKVSEYCRSTGLSGPTGHFVPPTGFVADLLHFQPDGDHRIIPVSIILACTALQSIMLFVGLFVGTRASWKKKIWASIIVGIVVYLLNLIRNTGIIWWYGQGIMSFWVVHDLIGKGGSLVALVGIAFVSFKYFPEFLRELVGVLDLPHRDGPVERTLRLGRKRPVP